MAEKSAELLAAEERSERSRPPVPREAPWLVFPYGKGQQAFFNLVDPNKKTYRKYIREMSYKLYWQSPSHQGWLVMLCADENFSTISPSNWKFGDCFLWNPLSLETIQLPNLLDWLNKSDQYYIRNCVLSSPPGNSDSMVFFLFSPRDEESPRKHVLDEESARKHVLVYCRPARNQKKWSKQVLPVKKYGLKSLICFKSKVHVACYENLHLEIETKPVTNDDDETLSIRSLEVRDETLFPIVGPCPTNQTHYVESCDELFKVHIIYHKESVNKEAYALQVLRMDFSSMAWEEVKSLGDHVLFLGKNTKASCSAAELGLTKGYVYFTEPNDNSLYKFDLEDGTILISLPCPNLPTPWLSSDWVIIPTTVRVVDCKRGREDIVIEAEEEHKSSINDDAKEGEAHKNNGGESEEVGIWDVFNEDIVKLIASYLHPEDYLHFRAVCKANRSANPTVDWRTSFIEKSKIVQTTTLSPWLVFSRKNDAIYDFLDPMHNKEKYIINLDNLLLDATIRFSKGGWLLMSKGYTTLFFFNPFTREMIQLPDVPDEWDLLFSGFSFSTSPTSSNCVVFAITDYDFDSVYIVSISRGDDSWRYGPLTYARLPSMKMRMGFKTPLNNPVFFDGVFYCLDSEGTLGFFDLKDYSWKVLAKPQRPCINSPSQRFLVECDGKLFSVFVGRFGKWVQIFRLDFSKMVWVKVKSLGKHMLFISNTSCLSAVASVSRMENKIYFPRYHGEGIMFYSLDTGRYHSLGNLDSAQDFYNTKEQLVCSWIEPNWSQSTEQELDWLTI